MLFNRFAIHTAMKKKITGFTLIELMITLAIIAILLTVGVPSLRDALKRNQVASHLKTLGSMVTFTRTEAISRGEQVAICSSANQSTCGSGADWSSGWIVFVDDGSGVGGIARDSIKNGDEEILQVYRNSGNNQVSVKDSGGTVMTAISFNSRGTLVQGVKATLRVCEEDLEVKYARALLLERTGRTIHSFDLRDSGGSPGPDNIYEDVNGDNLDCS